MNPEIDLEFWWIVNNPIMNNFQCILYSSNTRENYNNVSLENFSQRKNKRLLPMEISTGLSGGRTCMEDNQRERQETWVAILFLGPCGSIGFLHNSHWKGRLLMLSDVSMNDIKLNLICLLGDIFPLLTQIPLLKSLYLRSIYSPKLTCMHWTLLLCNFICWDDLIIDTNSVLI